jgi:hypothetical protein
MIKKLGEETKRKTMRTAPSAHVPLPQQCGSISRISSKRGPKVRISGMALSASNAIRSTMLSLVVALVTSPVIGINVLRGMRKLACLSLRSLLILMAVCVIGITVLWLLVLNWFDCLLG